MLPRYAKLLRNLGDAAEHPVSFNLAQAKKFRIEIRDNFEKTLVPFFSAASRILVTLDEKQINDLEKKLAEDDAKFKEKYIETSVEKQIELREKNIFEMIGMLVGDLKKEQKDKLKEPIKKIPTISYSWIEARRKWRGVLVELLRKKASSQELEKFFKQWLIDQSWLNTPEMRKFNSDLEASMDQMAVEVIKVLNDGQLRKAKKLVLGFAEEFEELSKEPLENQGGRVASPSPSSP